MTVQISHFKVEMFLGETANPLQCLFPFLLSDWREVESLCDYSALITLTTALSKQPHLSWAVLLPVIYMLLSYFFHNFLS